MRTPEQTVRLQMVRDLIARLEPELCDMSHFLDTHNKTFVQAMEEGEGSYLTAVDCGTSACIAGWAALLEKEDWTSELSPIESVVVEDRHYGGWEFDGSGGGIARTLGVNVNLFYPEDWSHELLTLPAFQPFVRRPTHTTASYFLQIAHPELNKPLMLAALDHLIANPEVMPYR